MPQQAAEREVVRVRAIGVAPRRDMFMANDADIKRMASVRARVRDGARAAGCSRFHQPAGWFPRHAASAEVGGTFPLMSACLAAAYGFAIALSP